MISNLKAVKPIEFDTSKLEPLDAHVIADVMKLTMMANDVTPPTTDPTATSSRKTSIDQTLQSEADAAVAEAEAIERKLDADINRVLQQEQGGDSAHSDEDEEEDDGSGSPRHDHNADKRQNTSGAAATAQPEEALTPRSDNPKDATVRKVSLAAILCSKVRLNNYLC